MNYENERIKAREEKPDLLPPRDRFLHLPKRETVINGDDVLNVKIALGTATTGEEFIGLM